MMIDLLHVSYENDSFFHTRPLEDIERASRMADFLTAISVLPVKRKVQWGQAHMQFAACLIVVMDEHSGKFQLSTRDMSQLAKSPLSSAVVGWIDSMAALGMLTPVQGGGYSMSPELRLEGRKLLPEELVNA